MTHEEKKVAFNYANAVIYYCYNYHLVPMTLGGKNVDVPTIINEAHWGCSSEHMASKWLGYCESYKDTFKATMMLYMDMDYKNKVAFHEWIAEVYAPTIGDII